MWITFDLGVSKVGHIILICLSINTCITIKDICSQNLGLGWTNNYYEWSDLKVICENYSPVLYIEYQSIITMIIGNVCSVNTLLMLI